MNDKKNRILIFSTAYYPFVGGAEVAVREITNRLDFNFDMITIKFQKNLPSFEKIGNINVYRVGVGINSLDKILAPFLGAKKAYHLLNKNDYLCFWEVMVSYSSIAGYICNILRKITFKRRIPTILTLQEGDSEGHLKYKWGGLIALFWKLLLRSADILTAISNFLLERAQKNGYKGKSFLVPNGVDISVFSKDVSVDVTSQIMKKLDKKDGDVFLVTTGRLTHKNGLDDVIRSLVSLPSNVSFIIIGRGERGADLQELARDLGVASRVKFLGFVPYEQIPEYFSACDIFIRPSRSEGFGNSFIEAMAFGLPVIATPVGGIVDFINDKETGVFCSPDNPKSIEVAVNTILKDSALRDNIIKNAYSRVRERYGWDLIASKMQEVFKNIS